MLPSLRGQLTPRVGTGQLPVLLLDRGRLPLQLPPCLCLGGSKETRPCTSVGGTTTSVGSRPSLTPSRKGILEVNPQKIARVTGILFVITYISSIPPVLFLYGPLLDEPRYILGGGGADNGLALGALLDLLLIVANIGTAVVLYPVVKRVNEILALGFVAARVVESAFIAVGLLS